jgi:hypothetical protein
VKEILHEFVSGLARWPLLLGSMLCYSFVLWEEFVTDTSEVVLASAGMIVGSVLLGGWLVSYVVDGERQHYRERAPIWKEDDTPKDDE